MWKLFLDDERQLSYIGEYGLEWRIARSVIEAQVLVGKLGMPVEMSPDHDLGEIDVIGKPGVRVASTSMEFLKWLQE